MPLYDFACDSGHRFETVVPLDADRQPPCPGCGQPTRKLPSAGMLLGRADAGLSRSEMPQTWKGTYNADPGYISKLRNDWSARQRLEAKYPELAGDQRPVLAHEGRYHEAPLRAGDVDIAQKSSPAPDHSHGHSHTHSHTHSAGPSPSTPSVVPPA